MKTLSIAMLAAGLALSPIVAAYAQDAAPASTDVAKPGRGAKFKECGSFYRAHKAEITGDQKHNWMDFIKVCAKKDFTPDAAMAKVATLP